ncbi:type I restriction modification DNA specificity domain protein [Leptospira interrogans serovar Canicola str. LT1962]|nr:type I restriction modification DNA specificity domain protein [Leptospira interrogans serovar Canicola str. LT1962]
MLDGAKVEWKTLGEVIISNTGGGTPSKAKSEYWNGEIPWASVGDLSIDGHFIKKPEITLLLKV